jgi:hypothetical protein
MISSILVGAEFVVENRASPVLETLSRQMTVFNEQLDAAKIA